MPVLLRHCRHVYSCVPARNEGESERERAWSRSGASQLQETKQPRAEQPCTQQPGAKQPVPPHRNQKQRHAAVKRTATARAALQPPRHPRQHPRAPPRRRSKPPTTPRAATPPHPHSARAAAARTPTLTDRNPAMQGLGTAAPPPRSRRHCAHPNARHPRPPDPGPRTPPLQRRRAPARHRTAPRPGASLQGGSDVQRGRDRTISQVRPVIACIACMRPHTHTHTHTHTLQTIETTVELPTPPACSTPIDREVLRRSIRFF